MNIMIDLETMGTTANSVILSIGAVAFNSQGVQDRFYQNVNIDSQSDRKVSHSSTMWWLNQSEEARKCLTKYDGVPLQEALEALRNWIIDPDYGRDETYLNIVKAWGDGSDFDIAILRHAYNDKTPWSPKNSRCYRTIKSTYPHIKADTRTGVYHIAVDDAEFQALHLIKIAKEVQGASII